MRVLGLDLGEKRVGVALSDPGGVLAEPLETFEPRGRADLASRVAALVRAHGAARVVAGLPLNTDGTAGPQAERARATAKAIRGAVEVPVALWNEQFSSQRADEVLRARGAGRPSDRGERDRLAAAFILQDYLDAGCPPP